MIEKREHEFSPIEESIRIPSLFFLYFSLSLPLSLDYFLTKIFSFHFSLYRTTSSRESINITNRCKFRYGSDEKLARKLRSFVGGTFFHSHFSSFSSDFFNFLSLSLYLSLYSTLKITDSEPTLIDC